MLEWQACVCNEFARKLALLQLIAMYLDRLPHLTRKASQAFPKLAGGKSWLTNTECNLDARFFGVLSLKHVLLPAAVRYLLLMKSA